MNDTRLLKQAQQRLLEPASLQLTDLHHCIGHMMHRQADDADLYFQHSMAESFVLEDGIVKEGHFSVDQGVGARVVHGEKTGFAFSDELNPAALQQAADAARSISRLGQDIQMKQPVAAGGHQLYDSANPIDSMATADKVAWLRRLDGWLREQEPDIRQVVLSLNASHQTILIVNADGLQVADIRPMVRFSVQVVVERDGRREAGRSGGGGRYDLPELMEGELPWQFCRQALDQALLNLKAEPAPAGPMTVVLGPGWPGILLHEAIGHGLEGDFNRKGVSAFSNRLGEAVASPVCTIVDDGTLPRKRGSLNVDDEGTPTGKTLLIEQGRLKGYMTDRQNARLMGMAPTGNGRRESYANPVLPRMTNTYMLPGKYPPEEIIASVQDGLYAANFGGGQVDITSGKFVFSASEAWRIRNGKLCEPVKGATLIGDGPSVLHQVSMVGNDLELDAGVGVCGKEGQSVPVGVGQPTLRLDELVVGGTQTHG